MPARPRDIGTAAETAVVRYLRTAGFPHAERRALRGTYDAGDITGTPGIAWEIKAGAAAKTASDGQVEKWLKETDRERCQAHANIGVLILARAGIGPANAGRWWAVLPTWTVAHLTSDAACNHPFPLFVPGNPAPVRLHLQHICEWLNHVGYGEPVEQAASA